MCVCVGGGGVWNFSEELVSKNPLALQNTLKKLPAPQKVRDPQSCLRYDMQ